MDNTSLTSEHEVDSGVESTNSSEAVVIYIRISVPELNMQKCLQFHQDDSVWSAKQHILSTVAKDLKDGLNYGLYCPPMNGKAGKFLDEERPLRDYPLTTPIGFLEFKFKRRVYKRLQINPKKLKQLHTKANLKQLMELIKKNDIEKISKWINKGIDPNFVDPDIGETPLTQTVSLPNSSKLIMTLVDGGAHLDLRNKKGLTPLHVAAQRENDEAVRVLLDLGASPNYRDSHGLTPLYHAVCNNVTCRCVEMLLYDHALIGIVDDNGLSELHQACKAGRVQHLEQLIYYGADMNCHNSGGNTPLHVCAVNNEEECARVLLFRGIDKNILNYANQNASEVAVISGNLSLAHVIRNFSPHESVPYQEMPKYNEKRRSKIPLATISNLQRCRSTVDRTYDNARSYHFGRDGGNSFEPSDSPRSLSISSNSSCPSGELNCTLIGNLNVEYNEPRTVIVEQGRDGFGFILRGAKVMTENNIVLLDFVPTPDMPGLQFFEHVDFNSVADRAGIRPGDFLLEINGRDVRTASHDLAVQLIQSSGERLVLVVLTPGHSPIMTTSMSGPLHATIHRSDSDTSEYSNTLSQQVDASSTSSHSIVETKIPPPPSAAPPPPPPIPPTVAGYGRYADIGIAELDLLDEALSEYENAGDMMQSANLVTLNKMAAARGVDPNNKVASIRSVHGKRLTSVAISSENLFQCNGAGIGRTGTIDRRQAFCGEPGKLWRPKSTQYLTSASYSCEDSDVLNATRDDGIEAIPPAPPLPPSANKSATIKRQSSEPYSKATAQFNSVSSRPASNIIAAETLDFPRMRMHRDSLPHPAHEPISTYPVSERTTPVTERANGNVGAFVGNRTLSLAQLLNGESSTLRAKISRHVVDRCGEQQNGVGCADRPQRRHSEIPTNGLSAANQYSSSYDLKTRPPPVPSRKPLLGLTVRNQNTADGPKNDNNGGFAGSINFTSNWEATKRVDSRCKGDECDSPDFIAQAEKARLEFVTKKMNGRNNNNHNSNSNCAITVNNRVVVKPSVSANSRLHEDLTQILARRAAGMQNLVVSEPNTNNSNLAQNARVIKTVAIGGITVDHSHTESFSLHGGTMPCNVASDKGSIPRFAPLDNGTIPHHAPPDNSSIKLQPSIPDVRNKKQFSGSFEYPSSIQVPILASLPLSHPPPPPPPPPPPAPQSTYNTRLPVHASTGLQYSLNDFCSSSSSLPTSLPDESEIVLPAPPEFNDCPSESFTQSNGIQRQLNLPPFGTTAASAKNEVTSRAVTSWTVDDVAAWLVSLRMDEHVESFARQLINGQALSRLGRSELIALGVTQVGQRMNIERGIKKVLLTQNN